MTVSTERANGRTARCFNIRRLEEGTTTACVTAEGVVTRIVASGTGLELTNLQMNATDKDFVPPALPVD